MMGCIEIGLSFSELEIIVLAWGRVRNLIF